MTTDARYTRRGFVRLCAALAATIGANSSLLAKPATPLRRYGRVALLDERDRPLSASGLRVGVNYLFYYPYVATPCFLLDLGKPTHPMPLQTEDGERYEWKGGVGPRRSVVAFSAICAHKLSHPAREVSFINYRHQPATFRDSTEHTTQRAQVIYCCSEKSVYDPIEGARVLGGPAKQPLTAIVLEQNHDGALYAIGTVGGELYEQFFERFSSRLALEFKTTDLRQRVSESATVRPLASYCRNLILC